MISELCGATSFRRYQPVPYDQQFEQQWKLFLEQKPGFTEHAGAETRTPWIDERIRELTGVDGFLERQQVGWLRHKLQKLTRRERGLGSKFLLEPTFPIDHFKGKYCLDVGCGAGRWTKTLLALGASVKSTDASQSSLRSVREFNEDVEQLDCLKLSAIVRTCMRCSISPFAGRLQHVHDPKHAFANIARSVKPGGELYVMIYAPEGMHNSDDVWKHRHHYHRVLKSPEERLQYAQAISENDGNVLGNLDMLNTFYNWVVPEPVIFQWFEAQNFGDVKILNQKEGPKCAYHVIGTKRAD